jgi:glutathione synthase/RimK-type ligase-like ATP-grasp enzyme
MAKPKLPIHIDRGSKLLDDQTVMLGDAYLRRWKIPVRTRLTIRFGASRWSALAISQSGLVGMRLNQSIAQRMGLTQGSQLCMQYKPSSRTLHLGPLIGVLVSRVNANRSDSPFGMMTKFCRELTEACRLYGGHVCFFTPNDLPPSSASTLLAWSYQGRWTKRAVPIPDVIYNRLTSRKLENLTHVQQFMNDVKSRYGAAVFNEKYLNKTEVFEALRQDAAMIPYLPESHLFKKFSLLKTMMNRHSSVFLKPITGSLGKGIIRMSKQGDRFVVQSTLLSGIRKQHFASLEGAFPSIAGKLRQQKYQIQQGLRLMEVGGRPVDFRALVQKGRTGEWNVTSIVGRIAPVGSFVSNVARGGSLSSAKDAIAKSNLPAGTRTIALTRLRKVSIELARSLENRIDAHFGELGIDLAVDQRGKVWLLEVNSKPSKDDNTPLRSGNIRPSVRQLIEYCQHLAKFTKKG